MNNIEFKILLKEVFNKHAVMRGRDQHTINELLHCLRYNPAFVEMNFNISIVKTNGEWWSIPTIDSFVDINTLGIWFDDDKIEYEHELIDDNGFLFYFDNITIYEKRRNNYEN